MRGFTINRYDLLRRIHSRTLEQFKATSTRATLSLELFGGAVLKPTLGEGKTYVEHCEAFADACLRDALKNGFKARLLYAVTGSGEGNCLCEVTSEDWHEDYFFDIRIPHLSMFSHVSDHQFHSAGPWSPVPHDERPWICVEPELSAGRA